MLRGRRPPYLPVLSLLGAMFASTARAQEPGQEPESQPASAPKPALVAIKARWIHPIAGPVIEHGVILLEGSKIAAVGKDVKVPADAEVIDLKDAHVMPGLIDPLSRLFLERGQGAPETSAADGLDRFDANAAGALQNGVTTVYVAPEGGGSVLGQGTVVKLTGLGAAPGTATTAVLKDAAAVDARLTQGPMESSNIARARLVEGLRSAFKAVEGYEKQKDEHKKAVDKYAEDRKKWLESQKKPAGEGAQSQPASQPGGGRRGGGPPADGGARQGGTGRGKLRPEQIEELRRRRGGGGPPGAGQGGPPTGGGPGRGGDGAGTRGGAPAGTDSRPAESQPAEVKKPTWPGAFQIKPEVEALQRVLKGEIPLRVEVHRSDEILMALDLAAELKIKDLQLVYATEGGDIADQISRAGAGVITGPLTAPMTRPPHLRNLTPALPAQLGAKGVPVSLGSGGARETAGRIIEAALAAGHGLDAEEALRAVTLEPARQLGVQAHVGSLEKGKDADLVVFSGAPLASDSRVLRVLVDGRTVFSEGSNK